MLCEGGVDYKIEVALACKCLVALDGPPAYVPPELVEYASAQYSCPEDEVTIRQARARLTAAQKQAKKSRHKRIKYKLNKGARPDMVQYCNSQAFTSALNAVLSEDALSEGVALIGSAVSKLFQNGSLPCEPGKLELFLGGLQASLTGEAGGPPGSSCSPVGGGTLPRSSSVPPEEQEEPASASIELAIGADQSRCFTTVRDRAGSEYEYDCRVPVTVDRRLPRGHLSMLTSRPTINKRTGEIDDLCHRCVAPRNNTHDSPPTRESHAANRRAQPSSWPAGSQPFFASHRRRHACWPRVELLGLPRYPSSVVRISVLRRGFSVLPITGTVHHARSVGLPIPQWAVDTVAHVTHPLDGIAHAAGAARGHAQTSRRRRRLERGGGRPPGTGHGTGRGSDAGRRLG